LAPTLGVTKSTLTAMPKADNIQHSYSAAVSYHHTLVQTRFSVASLYMTAAAFLVAAYFADTTKWKGEAVLIPLLGLAITLTAWLLEMRTEALLANLVKRGVATEDALNISDDMGFFKLMSRAQPLGVRVPFFRIRVPNSSFAVRYLTSHTLWFEVTYLSFLCFWVNAIWVAQ
jgi:hypothetical protein